MAYNPNAEYEPPRRAYYNQTQQNKAPAPKTSSQRAQDPYRGNGGYPLQPSQGYNDYYDQGYETQNGYADPYGSEMSNGRGPRYDDQYYGSTGYQDQGNGYNQHVVQNQPQRQYDPRYQQRSHNNHDQGYDRQPRRSHPQQSGADARHQQDARADPRAGRHHPSDQRQQPHGQFPSTGHSDRPSTSRSRSSMEEWKAREKERLHAEAKSPQNKTWDNAFPVFPAIQQKRDRSRPGTAEGRGERRSYESSKTTGATGATNGRPGASRENSYQNGYSGGWDAQNNSPGQARPEGRFSPPQVNGYGRPSQPDHDGNSYQQQPQRKMRGPVINPIDTRQPLAPPHPSYMDHQPLSPANLPPRPSTAGGVRRNPPQNQTNSYDTYDSRPQYSHQATASQGVDDIYSSYNQVHELPASTEFRRTQEIDAEMPDFDSGAPAQTSMLQKRTQTQRTPTSASTPTNGRAPWNSAQTQPTQDPRYADRRAGFGSAAVPEQYPPQQPLNGVQGDYADFGGNPYDQADPYSTYNNTTATPGQQQAARPFHPPFANEQYARRSMDDARQMPYRPGPGSQQNAIADQRGPGTPNGLGRPLPPTHNSMRTQQPDRSFNGPPPPRPDPNLARVGSVPPERTGMQRPLNGPSMGRADMQAPSNVPPTKPAFGIADGNADNLPHHPTPVRAGLMNQNAIPPAKPPPVRNYQAAGASPPKSQARPASMDKPPAPQPVTAASLNQLRAAVDANPQNNKRALELVKKLVEASTVLVPNNDRADPREVARGREKYILEAHKRLKRLVAAGYPDAQFYLADSYGRGTLGLETDDKEVFNLYQAAAKAGHPQAAFRTAVCCEIGPDDGGGTRRDPAKAVQWYRRAAALADVAGMYKLGIILLRGLLGQPRSVSEAINWLQRAAEKADAENPHALHEMATLYEPSNTAADIRAKLPASESRARDLFVQAAKLGHRGSQFRLGQAYEYGTLGLPIDNRASIAWYSKAAAQGDHQAELALSGWYLTGADGILEHSDTEAYLWARKAASSEPPLAKAMYAMGYFTETGIGCPANLDEAKRWYGRAASYNFPKARERLEVLRRSPPKGSSASSEGRGAGHPPPANGRLTRKDQKRDEAECSVM